MTTTTMITDVVKDEDLIAKDDRDHSGDCSISRPAAVGDAELEPRETNEDNDSGGGRQHPLASPSPPSPPTTSSKDTATNYSDKYIETLSRILELSQQLRDTRSAASQKTIEVFELRDEVRLLRDLCADFGIVVDEHGSFVRRTEVTRPAASAAASVPAAAAAATTTTTTVQRKDSTSSSRGGGVGDGGGGGGGRGRGRGKGGKSWLDQQQQRYDYSQTHVSSPSHSRLSPAPVSSSEPADTTALDARKRKPDASLAGQPLMQRPRTQYAHADDDAGGEHQGNGVMRSSRSFSEDEDMEAEAAGDDYSGKAEEVDTNDLVRWGIVLRKLFPGQLSSLKPDHRTLINDIVGEYLIAHLPGGRAAAERCQLTGVKGGKLNFAIPRSLIDDFTPWFIDKIDEMIGEDAFRTSSRNSTANSSVHAARDTTGASPTPPPSQQHSSIFPHPPPPKRPSNPAANSSAMSVVEPAPPPADLVAWTDVVRLRHPDFVRTVPAISLWVTSFVTNKLNLDVRHKAMSSFYERKTLTVGIPKSLHDTFLDAFDDRFFSNGEWINPKHREDCTGPSSRTQSQAPPPPTTTREQSSHHEVPSEVRGPSKDSVTRYKNLLISVMPTYLSVSKPDQVAIKKSVRVWLRDKVGAENLDARCVIRSREEGKPNTYGVPNELVDEFKGWARSILRGFFPENGIVG